VDRSLERVVVVGGSLGGLRAVEALRKAGFEGQLTLLGAEARLPYDRPPLSKEVMRGEREAETVTFRDADYFAGLGVDLLLGRAATGLDVAARQVLVGGERIPFDGLILATGSRPRMLPGTPSLEGVFTLRTLEDAVAIRAELEREPRVVVVGAGFIGSEVAASARSRGLDVTVLEALPVPLSRAVGERMGLACADLHREHGTKLICGAGVGSLEGTARVEAVRLTDGRVVEADLVVVGIGVEPAVEWLQGSGLTLRGGVVCDPTLSPGPPGMYAVGDIARWPNEVAGAEMRVEHWTNAAEQAIHAARALLADGPSSPFRSVPYFWSDQYGVRIQLVGYPEGDEDEIRVVEGDVEARQFVALYRRGSRVIAALGMNSSKSVMGLRSRISEGMEWDEAIASAEKGAASLTDR
jgi:NADPH-dependent 2,4-dienoyl-CoA reductase/sulfur reductase-like enzyme